MEGQALPRSEVDRARPDERKTGVRFAAVLQAVADGGQVRTDGDALVVEGADAVTLILTAATEIKTKGPLAAAAEKLPPRPRRSRSRGCAPSTSPTTRNSSSA